MDIDIEQLRSLMTAIEEHGINELEIRNGDDRIRLSRGPVAVAAPMMAAAPLAGAAPAVAAAPSAAEEPSGDFITSPFVGTFYSSPSPTSEAFVKEGDHIEVGQPLCIVEAMKLMNEIESEVSGKIVKIIAENGKPVEFGDPLFQVELS